jgi:hypothetical protein
MKIIETIEIKDILPCLLQKALVCSNAALCVFKGFLAQTS